MAQKLVLAEALDLLRSTEAREYEVDRSQARVSSSSKYRSELSRLVQAYRSVYQDYLRGVEILNYVRRTAMSSSGPVNEKLAAMCAGKMTAYMDRCEHVRRKQDNILLPLDQMSQDATGGEFILGPPLFTLEGLQHPLRRKEPFAREEKLTDGSYLFTVRNLDAYSVAAPEVTITIDVLPQRGPQYRLEKMIPCQCGWRRVVGVVGAAAFQLTARSKGLLRDAHVDIALHRLEVDPKTAGGHVEAGVATAQVIAQLPKLTDEELARLSIPDAPMETLRPKPHPGAPASNTGDAMMELKSLNVPYGQPKVEASTHLPEGIEVNPAGKTCGERLQRLRNTLNAWPNGGVMAVPLNREQQCVLQAVFTLPFPTELAED